MYTPEHETFWATYPWDLNPWIADDRRHMISTKTYPLPRACRLEGLQITRVETLDYRNTLPSTDSGNFHTVSKLGRWATAILMASTALRVEETLCVPAQITLKNRH